MAQVRNRHANSQPILYADEDDSDTYEGGEDEYGRPYGSQDEQVHQAQMGGFGSSEEDRNGHAMQVQQAAHEIERGEGDVLDEDDFSDQYSEISEIGTSDGSECSDLNLC